MARIELTIAKDYVAWGLWEGLRELVQNGLDERTDGHEFSVTYDPKKQQVKLVTLGSVLSPKTLLVGYSTKRSRQDQLGQFGEGYKLGLLGLVKSGHPVTIRTGADKWIPEIAASEKFDGELVLTIVVTPNAIKFREAVEIEVAGVSPEDWAQNHARFLMLSPPKNVVKTDKGTVLRDPDRKGHVYMGGIFVNTFDDLACGYDLPAKVLRIDRDRRMVDAWDLDCQLGHIWNAAVEADRSLVSEVDGMLRDDKRDTRQLRYTWCGSSEALRSEVVSRFKGQFGPDAIPVRQPEQVAEAEFCGKRGVVVPETLFELLKEKTGTLETAKEDLATAVGKEVGIQDLTPEESANLLRAADLVSKAVDGFSLHTLRVAEFKAVGTMGLYKDGLVYVARKHVANFGDCLAILVHEVAHQATEAGDGTISHQHAVEGIWRRIVLALVAPAKVQA